jgi:hypothetical protein
VQFKKTLLPVVLVAEFAAISIALPIMSAPYHIGGFWESILAIIFFLLNLAICYLSIKSPAEFIDNSAKNHKLLFLPVLVFAVYTCLQFSSSTISLALADMLPIMEIMAQRLVDGEDPYATIAIWDGMDPIYFPGYWLLYTPAVALNIDIRFINIIWFSGWLMALVHLFKPKGYKLFFAFVFLSSIFSWIAFNYRIFYTQLEELLLIGHYLFLVWALLKRKPLLLGLALALCLLSRYYIISWVPIYAAYLIWKKDGKYVLNTAFFTVIFSLIMMWISGAFSALDYLFTVPGIYFSDISNPLNAEKYRGLLNDYLGFARFFVPSQIGLFKVLFGLGIFVGPLALIYKFKDQDPVLLGLVSIKLVVAIFTSFLIGPYIYLFYIHPFLSLALWIYAKRETKIIMPWE